MAATGRRTVFRHKLQTPLTFVLTKRGKRTLDSMVKRTGRSRCDALEYLIRTYGPRVKKSDLVLKTD